MGIDEIKKLKELEKRLKKWGEDKKISFKEFEENLSLQDSVAHNMLIAIQSAIDLGNSLIEKKKLEIPSTYAEIFEILGKHKTIDKKLSNELKSLAKFRNVLAHLYWDLDLKKAYKVLKTKKSALEKFYKIVKEAMK